MTGVRLTRLGGLLLGVMVVLYLSALTSQSGLLLLLVGILAACLGLNFMLARRGLAGLELTAPAAVHLSEGQRGWQPWHLVNRGATVGFLQIDSPLGVIHRQARLDAGGQTEVLPDLVYARRGVYTHDRLTLASTWPFGLVRASRRLALAGEVVVCPALYPVDAPHAAAFEVMVGGKHRGQRRTASGIHFAGVRPWLPGDPLKQIHWRSSAKGQGIMVKTYEEELAGRAAFIVDSGQGGDQRVLDDCIRATGSLMFAALDAGHHVAWVDLARIEGRLIPPFEDGGELLDALARIELAPGCLTRERLLRAVSLVPRRSILHLVLTALDPAVVEAVEHVREQGRLLTLYLPVGLSVATPTGVPTFRYHAKGLVEPAVVFAGGEEP